MSPYRLLSGFVLLLITLPVQAQTLESARDAFRSGDYSQSARLAEQVVAAHPDSAQAHYLLARIYTETALADRGKAVDALKEALRLEPENVEFLTASLVQRRVDRATYIQEIIAESERIELAKKLLRLDPTNGVAHEELGAVAIRDFWRYRNALMFPKLSYQRGIEQTRAGTGIEEREEERDLSPVSSATTADPFASTFGPNDVFIADQFDLSAIEAQGVPAIRFTERAAKAYQTAIGHLDAAITADPRRRSVYDQLMRVYAIQGDWNAALERLSTMYVHFPDDPQTWFYLGLAHHKLGNGAAADQAFERALRLADSDADDARVADAYRSISLLLRQGEEALGRTRDEQRIQQFWASEDPLFLTPYNERKLEHYGRITHADLLYSAPQVDLRGWETERGQIIIRYGAPPSEVTMIAQPGEFASHLGALYAAGQESDTGGDDKGDLAFATPESGSASNPARRRAGRPAQHVSDLGLWRLPLRLRGPVPQWRLPDVQPERPGDRKRRRPVA